MARNSPDKENAMPKRIGGQIRLRIGPKRSRVKFRLRPIVFFITLIGVLGAFAIAMNVNLQDQINAYHAKKAAGETSIPKPDQ